MRTAPAGTEAIEHMGFEVARAVRQMPLDGIRVGIRLQAQIGVQQPFEQGQCVPPTGVETLLQRRWRRRDGLQCGIHGLSPRGVRG